MSENTTDTPITDERRARNGNVLCAEANLDLCRDLERQLAEALKQRNAYRYEGQTKVTEMAHRIATVEQQRDTLAEAIKAIKRFAATKATHAWIEQIARESLATFDQKEK